MLLVFPFLSLPLPSASELPESCPAPSLSMWPFKDDWSFWEQARSLRCWCCLWTLLPGSSQTARRSRGTWTRQQTLPSLLPVLPCRKVSLSWWFRIANQQSSVLWEKYNTYDRFHVGYFWTPESSAQDSVGQKAGEPGPVGQEPLGRGFSHIALTACLDLCSRCTVGSPSLTVFTSVFLSPGKDLTHVPGSPTHDVRGNSSDFHRYASWCSAEAVISRKSDAYELMKGSRLK